MDLPGDIETQIIDYLNMEYGFQQAAEKFVLSDLKYSGEYTVNGKLVKYWKFPCAEESGCWATVEPYEEGFLIGIQTDFPTA